tara:strand:- start:8380 stop:11493 length:3114 start_codon:yes stop_codon:yes gene_type:complete
MAKPIETLSIQLKFKDAGSQAVIEKVKGSLKQLQLGASGATPKIKGLRDQILAQGRASINSVSNINAQRTALAALRDEARIGGKNFKQLTEDIKKLDAQLGKTSKKSANMGARRATQTAGAIISGGIFGGPEGALGATGGAVLGGVEGAFAGAAIGAVVGGFRQSLGETAAYAASIDKLKIALEGVAPSTEDYNSALATAGQVTRELNVPQEAAVAGITRLTAAVVGANGPVADAETVFKNVTAAIKATGGNSEDVQGAITAMVQVFSKGKVSAEELSGQLGERLPGAVTLFAKANNMSLQELQDNLKKGTVGLNELMAFVRQLGVEYGDTAKEIAASGAEAGARLTVAINGMRISVGNALKDVGAGFQEGFAEFISDITPTATRLAAKLGETLKNLGPIVKALAKNLDTVAVALAGALGAAGIAAIIAKVIELGGVTKALTAAVGALNLAMLGNPIFLAAMGGAIAVGGIYALTKAISEQADEVERLNRANDQATRVENREYAQGSQEVARELKQALSTKGTARQELRNIEPDIKRLRDTVQKEGGSADTESLAQYELSELVKKQQALLATISAADKSIRKLKPKLATTKELGIRNQQYEDPKAGEDGGDGGKALARRIEQAQRLEARTAARLNLAQSEGRLGRLLARQANERASLQARINKLKEDGFNKEVEEATAAAKTNLESKQKLELEKEVNKIYEAAIKPLDAAIKSIQDKVKFDERYKELLKQGINPERAKAIISIEKAFEKTVEVLDVEIDILKAKVAQGKATQDQIDLLDELIRKRREAEGRKEEGVEGTEGIGKKPTFMEGLDELIEEQKKALQELLDPLKQVKKAADAIGEAFKKSFRGIIDGSMSGRQALASFFQSVADHFADMAAEIAAEAIKLAALQFVKFIIGSFVGGGGGGGSTGPNVDAIGAYMNANGNVFAKNKIVPYAMGGIVNKPTLFQYANGGSGRFGLMGEAGPEAIMPLRRGANGKLGVEASGAGVGNITVNVDASGSSVEGDASEAAQLGKMLGAAVQAELVKQKRPGGLLAS